MPKRKTALAMLEHEIDLLINMSNHDTLIMDKHTLLFKIKGLIKNSKPQEKQDLIKSYADGIVDTITNNDKVYEEWFNDTFENEN